MEEEEEEDVVVLDAAEEEKAPSSGHCACLVLPVSLGPCAGCIPRVRARAPILSQCNASRPSIHPSIRVRPAGIQLSRAQVYSLCEMTATI